MPEQPIQVFVKLPGRSLSSTEVSTSPSAAPLTARFLFRPTSAILLPPILENRSHFGLMILTLPPSSRCPFPKGFNLPALSPLHSSKIWRKILNLPKKAYRWSSTTALAEISHSLLRNSTWSQARSSSAEEGWPSWMEQVLSQVSGCWHTSKSEKGWKFYSVSPITTAANRTLLLAVQFSI